MNFVVSEIDNDFERQTNRKRIAFTFYSQQNKCHDGEDSKEQFQAK